MSLLDTVRNLDRLRQITQVLAKHGFGELAARMGLPGAGRRDDDGKVVPPRLGARVRLVLQDLGTTFVKLGQIVSTRADVLPEEIVVELKKLQDDVPPFPAEEARKQIEEGLGAPVEQLFTEFDERPLASASVAQVHRARLRVEEGDEPVAVVVKVQRPGIADTVERDLQLMHVLARLLEHTVPETRVYSPTGLVREFEQAITAELDFTTEAQNAERFAANFAGETTIRFPQVYREATAKRVITLEHLDGVKIDRAVALGADGVWIAETSVRWILKMVFEDGFFHADPHPGNIMILPRPNGERYDPQQELQIGLLDLGLVGRLSPELRDRTVDLLMAAARRDPDALAEALLAIGRQRHRVDEDAFRAHVAQLAERHLGRPLNEMEAAAILRDVIAGALRFEIEIPSELTMLLRALMTIEGVGKEIHPELDVLEVARPYLAKIIWQRYHPARLGQELLRDAGRLSSMARHLPHKLQDIVEDLRSGELTVRAVDPERAQALDRLGRRIRGTAITFALFGGGVALRVSGRDAELGFWLLVAAGATLVLQLVFDWRRG